MAAETEMEEMELMLYDAAIKGNVDQLVELVQQKEGILNLVTAAGDKEQSPLHIAAQFGHVDFVKEIIDQKREYARAVNSQRQTPLHLASMKGNLELVKILSQADKCVCLFRDKDGRTPLHLAAMNGRLEVVEELFSVKAAAAWMLTSDGEPILHLCANHKQIDAVKKLVELVNERAFVNLKDNEDSTILHLLASKGKVKMVNFLINKGAKINTRNIYGSTAFDVLFDNISTLSHFITNLVLIYYGAETNGWYRREATDMILEDKRRALDKMFNEGLLVFAVLMATVAFEAGLRPPGGVWPDTGYHNQTNDPDPRQMRHTAGQSVMSHIDEGKYARFLFSNTATLLLSLTLIILLASGSSSKGWLRRYMLFCITYASVCSMVFTYNYSVQFLSVKKVLNEYFLLIFALHFPVALLVAPLSTHSFTTLVLILSKLLIWLLKFWKKLCCARDTNIGGSRSTPPCP